MWTLFPYPSAAYRYDDDVLREVWPRLHAGDAEPWPADAAVRAAWQLFHAGDFELAMHAGEEAARQGAAGATTVTNKAQALYATYLEPREDAKHALLMDVARRAELRIEKDPLDANAWYASAYALGRYSQSLSITKAIAHGMGTRIKSALETTIRIAPRHADAHIALGAFHAEVIDKIGSLLGHTQGASKDAGLAFFKTALKLNPRSAIAMIEFANGLVMLEGDKRNADATLLYEAAATSEPLDAAERLDVERARAALAD